MYNCIFEREELNIFVDTFTDLLLFLKKLLQCMKYCPYLHMVLQIDVCKSVTILCLGGVILIKLYITIFSRRKEHTLHRKYA
jgi:hypothetical protein